MLYISQITKDMTRLTDTLFVTDNQDMTRLSNNLSVTNEQVYEYDIRYVICDTCPGIRVCYRILYLSQMHRDMTRLTDTVYVINVHGYV
jgi:hypothetical protein